MEDRAAQTVRTHGDVSFAQGGSFYDVIYCMQNYGIVPQEAMPEPGTLYGDTLPNHNEVDHEQIEEAVSRMETGFQRYL